MDLDDNFFGKVKNKTNVDKETLVDLAKRLNDGNMKDEKVLRSIIRDLSKITGKKLIRINLISFFIHLSFL